jgi:hypothetical protein
MRLAENGVPDWAECLCVLRASSPLVPVSVGGMSGGEVGNPQVGLKTHALGLELAWAIARLATEGLDTLSGGHARPG